MSFKKVNENNILSDLLSAKEDCLLGYLQRKIKNILFLLIRFLKKFKKMFLNKIRNMFKNS